MRGRKMRGLAGLLIAAALSIGALPAAADSDRHGTAMSHHAFAHRKFAVVKSPFVTPFHNRFAFDTLAPFGFGWGSYESPPPPVVAVSPPPPAPPRRPASD